MFKAPIWKLWSCL